MTDALRKYLEQKHRLKESGVKKDIPDQTLEATYADEIAAYKAGQQEATKRLKNCLNCEKCHDCKLWCMANNDEITPYVNYHCVCLSAWELAEEYEEI